MFLTIHIIWFWGVDRFG